MAKKVKVSDYIADYIADIGVSDVFMVTGGGAMHLNESFGSNPRISYWCNHHEQACAIAAESYARLRGLGVCNVTTGPGGTNTLTGVAGAWLDSIPMLVISGQVKREDLIGTSKVRQIGLQELPIADIVKPMTKYAVTVMDESKIRYHLEKALYLATRGRPGPVWLDIPLDVQAAQIDPNKLSSFLPEEIKLDLDSEQEIKKKVSQVVDLLKKVKRPVILVGNGIRLGGAVEEFHNLIEKLNVPVLTAVTAHDLIPSDHRFFFWQACSVWGASGKFRSPEL